MVVIRIGRMDRIPQSVCRSLVGSETGRLKIMRSNVSYVYFS